MDDLSCDHLANPNPWALSLSVFLVLGILLSYLPQHSKIITSGTSAGLSPWWVLLGTISSITGLTNIIVLPTSQHDMRCCSTIGHAACGAAMLGIIQVGVQWACFMGIMILFVVYFPRGTDAVQVERLPEGAEREMPKPRDALIVAASCVMALFFAVLGSFFFLVAAPHCLLAWANFLGVAASIMSSIQYLPQIWMTYRLGETLSLSIATMLIQVPGAFVFAFSLWLRVGWQGWSTWMVYIVTAILQSILLAMAITFWMRDKGQEREQSHMRNGGQDSHGISSERDPLLSTVTNYDRRPENSSTLRTIGSKAPRTPIDSLYRPSPSEVSSSGGDESDHEGQ